MNENTQQCLCTEGENRNNDSFLALLSIVKCDSHTKETHTTVVIYYKLLFRCLCIKKTFPLQIRPAAYFGREAGEKIDVGNCTPAAICNYAFLKPNSRKSSQDF